MYELNFLIFFVHHWGMLEDLVVIEFFWQMMCLIMKLEVVMCEVQCYINVYYYFYCWVIYNSFVSQWPMYECFCVPVKADLFFQRKKKKFSLHYSILWQKALSWDNWLCWRITNVAAPPRSSNPHQCQLPNEKSALFRNRTIAKWLNRNTKRMFKVWKGIFWEMLPTSKKTSLQW